MADYQKMYDIVCDAASKAIDAMPEEANRLLQTALLEAIHPYLRRRGSRLNQRGLTPFPIFRPAQLPDHPLGSPYGRAVTAL